MSDIQTIGWLVVDSTFNAAGHTVIGDEDRACEFRNEGNSNPEDYAGEAPYSVMAICSKKEAQAEIDRLRAENERLKAELQAKPNQWIAVEDRLPDRSDFYIVYPEPKYVDGVCYFNKEMDCRGHEPNTFETESEYGEVSQHRGITHWMPLPEPPITEGKDNE